EAFLQRTPLWRFLDRQGANPSAFDAHALHEHAVIVGLGRVGEPIVTLLERLKTPFLVVENDAEQAKALTGRQIPILYGDAANSEIMSHAGLEAARVLVVTLPDEAAVEMVVAGARRRAPDLPIIARAATQ